MRRLARWGLLLTAISAFPIVQDAREVVFWRQGGERFAEDPALELPLRFAGHTITIEDPLPHGGPRSEKEVRSTARVLLDGREILPARPALVRPGRDDLGRYHLWIDAMTFVDRRTGESSLYLGRRLGAPNSSRRLYDILRIGSDGSHTLQRLSFEERAKTYPIWRTIQFLNDWEESPYTFSLTNVWPSLLIPVLYPLATFVVGLVLLAAGLWLDRRRASLTLAVLLLAASPARAAESDFVARDFHFTSGETLPELRLHVLTLGTLRRDAQGHATNAVLVLHGTGGTGRQFMARQFADELYGKGQPLDTTAYYVILPDGIGHGRSSKPSDGLRMRFPKYDYDDMVRAHHLLLTQHLGVDHLRLVMGTSMGGMHSWVWGETYPAFMDALMPLACQPVAIVGRNRLWRQMIVDAITKDPEWKGGDYEREPQAGLRTAVDLLLIAGSAPIFMQNSLNTRDTVDRYLQAQLASRMATTDANDLLYQVEASRHYDPSPKLESIVAPVMFVNSADDFINPPELGIAEREVKRVKRATFVLIPASDKTRGHGTHTWAALWKDRLVELLARSKR